MDPVLGQVLVNLVSSGLWDATVATASLVRDRGKKSEWDVVEAAVAESLDGVIVSVPKQDQAAVVQFLRSPDAEATIRQLFASRMTSDVDSGMPGVDAARDRFARALDGFVGSRRSVALAVFDAMLAACDAALATAINEGVLAAHEARSVRRHQALMGELTSLRHSLDLLVNDHLDIPAIVQFEEQYRRQVGARHSYVRPPNLDHARKLPIDEIYVAPGLYGPLRSRPKDERVAACGVEELMSGISRTVVIGQPGGGKSTLTLKICSDLAARYDERLVAGRRLTPVLVVLREYASDKEKHRWSILEYIEATSRTLYQTTPPPGAFEYLLSIGSLLVIFDGLDELLDTARRQEVSDDVEAFSHRFPAVPILVTSREVGYEAAPLDPARFDLFRLAPFSEKQISEYATKWFAADPDLVGSQKEDKAAAFVRDSELVADLRTNPLMLALMCSIYRGDNYIPRNRPDVYEKCALMLFEQWDRHRHITVPLTIEYHLFPAMQHLARWIYCDPSAQAGATETQLVQQAVTYLVPRRFDSAIEAEAAAREFIEFCRGRAWVFTDTGTTPTGESLYQFTHRTFLEYFTARDLVRNAESPAALGDELRPRIVRQEWDVVAQLAFQVMSRAREGAADVLLSELVQRTARAVPERRRNALSFAARCLEFLVPSPRVTREVATAVWRETVAWAREHDLSRDGGRFGTQQPGLVGDLFAAAVENREPIQNAFVEAVRSATSSGPQELAVAVTMDLELFSLLRHSPSFTTAGLGFAREMTAGIVRAMPERFEARAERDANVAFDLLLQGHLTFDRYLEWHRFSTLFATRRSQIFGAWPSAAGLLLHVWVQSQSIMNSGVGDVIGVWRAFGQEALRQPLPWRRSASLEKTAKEITSYTRHLSREMDALPDGVPPMALFGVFTLLAACLEVTGSRSEEGRELLALRRVEPFAPVLRMRDGGSSRSARRAIRTLGFEDATTSFALAWARCDFDLVPRRRSSQV